MPFSYSLLCSGPHCCYLSHLLTVSLTLLIISTILLIVSLV